MELWVKFPVIIEADQHLIDEILENIKKIVKEGNQGIKIQAMISLFKLFDYTITRESKHGPRIFNTIGITALKNSQNNVFFRSFCLGNILDFFRKYPKLQVSIFLDPLL